MNFELVQTAAQRMVPSAGLVQPISLDSLHGSVIFCAYFSIAQELETWIAKWFADFM